MCFICLHYNLLEFFFGDSESLYFVACQHLIERVCGYVPTCTLSCFARQRPSGRCSTSPGVRVRGIPLLAMT